MVSDILKFRLFRRAEFLSVLKFDFGNHGRPSLEVFSFTNSAILCKKGFSEAQRSQTVILPCSIIGKAMSSSAPITEAKYGLPKKYSNPDLRSMAFLSTPYLATVTK